MLQAKNGSRTILSSSSIPAQSFYATPVLERTVCTDHQRPQASGSSIPSTPTSPQLTTSAPQKHKGNYKNIDIFSKYTPYTPQIQVWNHMRVTTKLFILMIHIFMWFPKLMYWVKMIVFRFSVRTQSSSGKNLLFMGEEISQKMSCMSGHWFDLRIWWNCPSFNPRKWQTVFKAHPPRMVTVKDIMTAWSGSRARTRPICLKGCQKLFPHESRRCISSTARAYIWW